MFRSALRTCIAAAVWAGFAGLAIAQDAFEAARAEGTHILMRHALAPGTGDPADFTLGDCSTQRNLSDEGREQAQRIGERLRENGVEIDVVLTSQWCRSRDTANILGFEPVEDEPTLNSFFRNRGEAAAQTAALTERLKALDAAGQKAALVTHQVNITALTDVFPASGEMIVIALGDDGQVSVEGRIETR